MTRFFSSRKALLALVAASVLCFAGTGAAQTVPHKEKASGTIHASEFISPTVALQRWTAEGTGTQLGKYTETGHHTADLVSGAIDGEFTITAADGATISGIYSGSFTINGDGTVSYEVTAYYLRGTGRLRGVTGVTEVEALATGVTSGSTFHYEDEGHWIFP
jgi:hypothetical protein